MVLGSERVDPWDGCFGVGWSPKGGCQGVSSEWGPWAESENRGWIPGG